MEKTVGYNTEFAGVINIAPALNKYEIAYLRKFAATYKEERAEGPYYVEPLPDIEKSVSEVIPVLDVDAMPHGQPGQHCEGEPSDDGTGIQWSGGEKFIYSLEWMAYLIDTFLQPGATVQTTAPRPGWTWPEEFAHFTFDHVCNGVIDAQGDDLFDRWRLVVTNNEVSYQTPRWG
ncbi:hypothetical protein ACFQRI_24165 [Saccharopolyspora griseoalba]|uniref:Uncharacterized protein n=2 Tax=Saccharopolyspora griseoalba TaxID=1431848 RepID=A0ABW2LS85_9PSEU